jgi:hypothetical protein
MKPLSLLIALSGSLLWSAQSMLSPAPGLAQSATSPAADTSVFSAPFDVSSGRPVIELMVNGQGPYLFIFDTGAGVPVVRPALVEVLNLSVTGQDEVGSPMGDQPLTVDLVRVDTLSLNGAVVADFDAYVIEMGVGHPDFDAIMGVVGPGLFNAFGRVAYDFEAYTVEVGGDFKTVDEAAWQAIGAFSPIVETELMIGDVAMTVHIDTGSPGILTAPEGMEDILPLTGPVEVIGRGRTVDAEFEIRGAPLEAIAHIGQATIPLQGVRFFRGEFGNLGTGALHGLQLEFDWTNDRFALTGEAEPRAMTRGRRAVQREAEPE